MKKLLFIIPSLATGGTNSSLDSLYSCMKNHYDISVFSISHQPRVHQYSFDEVLLPQNLSLSLLYSNYHEQRGVLRIFALWYKFLRKVFGIFGRSYLHQQGKHVAKTIEEKINFDYIIAFQEGFATAFASLFRNTNKIGWIHCDYNKYLAEGLSEETIYKMFKKIVCVSEYTASIFKDRYPSLSAKTLAIHNLINSKRLLYLSREPINDDHFIKNGATLLTVGRFSPVKRFRIIPAIASKLKKRGIVFRWFVIGPCSEGNEANAFKANIKENSVDDCVKWLGMKANPYPFFLSSDIYICTSESEACPMVFKEAQFFGLPIISTDFPSSYEFIHDDEGIITSIEELADAIANMINKIQTGEQRSICKRSQDLILLQLHSLFN